MIEFWGIDAADSCEGLSNELCAYCQGNEKLWLNLHYTLTVTIDFNRCDTSTIHDIW